MAIGCGELLALFQRDRVIYNVEHDSVLKSYYRIRPCWVQRHVVHIIVVALRQQQCASHVVPQFHCTVNLTTCHKDGFPVTYRQTQYTATVQRLPKWFELYLLLEKNILYVITQNDSCKYFFFFGIRYIPCFKCKRFEIFR